MSKGTAAAIAALAMTIVGASSKAAERVFYFGPDSSQLTIRVFRAGMLSGMGHEHLFAPEHWSGSVRVDPAALGRAAVELRVDAASFHDHEPGLSDSDRAKVEQQTRDKVLEASRYPDITFAANELVVESVAAAAPNAGAVGQAIRGRLVGTITLHGHSRPIAVPFTGALTTTGVAARGSVELKLHDFGISPPSAALGTIKVKDELLVRFEVNGRLSSH